MELTEKTWEWKAYSDSQKYRTGNQEALQPLVANILWLGVTTMLPLPALWMTLSIVPCIRNSGFKCSQKTAHSPTLGHILPLSV